MAENQESNIRLINKLALLADATESIFPNSKRDIVLELNDTDFDTTQTELLIPKSSNSQFKIDMSGTEFIFLKDGLLNDVEDKI